jgi:hypothetical protein
LLAGCQPFPEPAQTPVGVLHVFTGSVDRQYRGRPEATFLRGSITSFPESRVTLDTCVIASVGSVSVGQLNNLDAGDSIAFTTGSGTIYLLPTRDLTGTITYLASTGLISMTPGEVVRFEIPGAAKGFSSATLMSLTAPPFTTLTPISGHPPDGQPLTVKWAPAGDDSSRLEVSLRFASPGAPQANQQVLCEWRDDGSGTIAANLLAFWSIAQTKQIQFTRYRTLRQDVGGQGMLFFLATFDTLPPVAP